MRACISLLLILAAPGLVVAEAEERGSVRFFPLGGQQDVPARYRLGERSFDYSLSLKLRLPSSKITVYKLQFPSALESEHKENNTVHAEYYLPEGEGPFPATIILDITGGDQSLSRTIATYLARRGIAGLFVQMAYYGPRRPPGSRLRLLSPDLEHTLQAIRQTVLDLRLASAWLASRREVDAEKLGILGTSLGSFVGSLTAEMEPRLRRVVVLLGGGGLVDGYYDHPKARDVRQLYETLGGTRDLLKRLIAPVDPLTCAANLKDRRVLILAGKADEVVPPKMARWLWEATGEQKIVWYECGHYTAILYLAAALDEIASHLSTP